MDTPALAIACRYVPYDQWFVTHAHTGWKVKRLKETMLAKALGLPFDRRILETDVPVVRPPSPITFAPDENSRPVSPIRFASRPLKKKASSAGVLNDSMSDGVDAGREGGAVAPESTLEKGLELETSEGASAEADDDDEQADEVSYNSGEGYEEDDESDEDVAPPLVMRTRTPPGSGSGSGRIYVPPIIIPGPPPSSPPQQSQTGVTAVHVRPPPGAPSGIPGGLVSSVPRNSRDKEQIFTSAFTFVRFSTGQTLEDDYNVGWYHFAPYELIEIHSACPPPSFVVSAFLGDILVRGGSYSIPGLASALAGSLTPNSGSTAATVMSLSKVGFSMNPGPTVPSGSGHSHSSSILASLMAGETPGVSITAAPSSGGSKLLTVSLPFSSPRVLTSLPRHDTEAYVQPYWEGWVRALRVVYRPEVDPTSQYSLGGGGNTAALLALGGHHEDPIRRREHGVEGSSRRRTKMEWRDRWVVIRAGVILLCKDRNDTAPTHRLPLSCLTNLRGADHLAHNVKQKDNLRSSTRESRSTLHPGSPQQQRPNSSRSTAAPANATSFSSNQVLGGATPRRSTSVSANSSTTSRPSTRRGTVSGVTTLGSSTSSHVLPSTNSAINLSSSTSSIPASSSLPNRPATRNIGPESTSGTPQTVPAYGSSTPKPGVGRSALAPLVVPKASSSTTGRISSSTPISPVSVISPPLSPSVSRHPAIGAASTSIAGVTSPASSSTSAFVADPSSNKRDVKTVGGRGEKSLKGSRGRAKATSLERDLGQEQRERKRRQKELDLAKEAAEDLEYLQKWDDFSFGFGKKKDKDKSGKAEKGKEKEHEKDKKSAKMTTSAPDADRVRERERRQQQRDQESELQRQLVIATFGIGGYHATSGVAHSVLPQPLARHDSGTHGRSLSHSTVRQRHNLSSSYPSKSSYLFDKTYIPGSKEEADSIGMRIICAKFRVDPIEKPSEGDQNKPSTSSFPRGPTSTLEHDQGEADDELEYGYLRRRDDDKVKDKRKAEKDKRGKEKEKSKREGDFADDKGRNFPPRKASLPGLGLSFGTARDKDKLAERSFEKMAKKKEKTQKKRNRDDSGDDFPGATTSVRSWKIGKKSKENIGSDPDRSRSAGATDEDEGLTDDGGRHPDDSPLVRVRVQVQTKAAGLSSERPQPDMASVLQPSVYHEDDSDEDVNLSSPVFAHSTDDDDTDDEFAERRRGYRYGGYHEEKLKKLQQQRKDDIEKEQGTSQQLPQGATTPKPISTKRDDEKFEWIVLDMGSQTAYNSILRIFHRHCTDSLQSVFVSNGSQQHGRDPSSTVPHYFGHDDGTSDDDLERASSSHHPSALRPTRRRKRSTSTLALPYPEWRYQTVNRARSQGMLEYGRPAELTIASWKRDSEMMTPEHRLQRRKEAQWRRKAKHSFSVERRSTDDAMPTPFNTEKQRAIERPDNASSFDEDTASDAGKDEYEAPLTSDPILLDDSEEESEEEFARWWRDLPRQSSAQTNRELRQRIGPQGGQELRSSSSFDTLVDSSALRSSSSLHPSTSMSTLASTSSMSTAPRQPPPIKTTGLNVLKTHFEASPLAPSPSFSALTPTPAAIRRAIPTGQVGSPILPDNTPTYFIHGSLPTSPKNTNVPGGNSKPSMSLNGTNAGALHLSASPKADRERFHFPSTSISHPQVLSMQGRRIPRNTPDETGTSEHGYTESISFSSSQTPLEIVPHHVDQSSSDPHARISVLHHTSSLQTGSFSPPKYPSSIGSPRTRDRTITLPAYALLHDNDQPGSLRRDPSSHSSDAGAAISDDGDGDLHKPILTPQQILQIENETISAKQLQSPKEALMGLTTTPTRQLAQPLPSGSSPPGSIGRALGKRYPARGLRPSFHSDAGSEEDRTGNSRAAVEPRATLGGDRVWSKSKSAYRTSSNPASPSTRVSPPDLPWNSNKASSSTHTERISPVSGVPPPPGSPSTHAKDILRRVRSGSSLHLLPMGVLEETSENGHASQHTALVEDRNGSQDGQKQINVEGIRLEDRWDDSAPKEHWQAGGSSRNGHERSRQSILFAGGSYGFASVNGHAFIG